VKKFSKTFNRCDECPSCGYVHFDGEGESCPYSYWHAFCHETRKDFPPGLIIEEPHEIIGKEGYVPKRKIPDWCPLPDV